MRPAHGQGAHCGHRSEARLDARAKRCETASTDIFCQDGGGDEGIQAGEETSCSDYLLLTRGSSTNLVCSSTPVYLCMTMAECPVLVSITNQISQVIQLLINRINDGSTKKRINLNVLLQFKPKFWINDVESQ